MNHASVTELADGVFGIGFEDLYGGGDEDYNDIVFYVTTKGFEVKDTDTDDDGVDDEDDNCPTTANADQGDYDKDGIGDVCDPCPKGGSDDDADGACVGAVGSDDDNCPDDANTDQADSDKDGAGDACDLCPYDPKADGDEDGYCADEDNCPPISNDQTDSDGAGDECDTCPYDADDDADEDGVCGDDDQCASTTADAPLSLGVNRWADRNGDGIFETTLPKGKGPTRKYTIYDTDGCSCTQLADELGLGYGPYKFGCSISAMDDWTAYIASLTSGRLPWWATSSDRRYTSTSRTTKPGNPPAA